VIAQAFLRLGRTDDRVFERLGRYEMNMWRQTAQTILLLNVMSRHVNDGGHKSSPTYFRRGTQKTSQHLPWPPIKPFLYHYQPPKETKNLISCPTSEDRSHKLRRLLTNFSCLISQLTIDRWWKRNIGNN